MIADAKDPLSPMATLRSTLLGSLSLEVSRVLGACLESRIVPRHARLWAGYPRPSSNSTAWMAGSSPAMTASGQSIQAGFFPSATLTRRSAMLLRRLALTLALLAPAGAAVAENYSAIAYSHRTGAAGRSWEFDSRKSAERAAMGYCRESGARDCRVMVWTNLDCAVFAVGSRNRGGVAWDYDEGNAIGEAMRQCSKQTSRCRVVANTCER
jgi:hypothetical protein